MGKKEGVYLVFGIIILLATISFASAGFFDWFKRPSVTGRDTATVDLNISIGAGSTPIVSLIFNDTSFGTGALTEGPLYTTVTFNFSVTDADGVANLNSTGGMMIINRTGVSQQNLSCQQYQSSGNEANYSCKLQMAWFNLDGIWSINATVRDASNNVGTNATTIFTVASTTAFKMNANLAFATINAGATNTTASDPLTLNNSGNQNISAGSISVNGTSLTGEVTVGKLIHLGNITVGNDTTGTRECDLSGTFAVRMNWTQSGGSFVNVNGTLPVGNYTINDGTGQEQLYVCIFLAGSELTQQAYSTLKNGSWTVQAV